ncbi:hypothetical protein B0H11DRAFT_2220129 [Mycena galericulata]|nr:hypothetical protein B0H11DRAFT_2220129 [Mycena galericulata]
MAGSSTSTASGDQAKEEVREVAIEAEMMLEEVDPPDPVEGDSLLLEVEATEVEDQVLLVLHGTPEGEVTEEVVRVRKDLLGRQDLRDRQGLPVMRDRLGLQEDLEIMLLRFNQMAYQTRQST